MCEVHPSLYTFYHHLLFQGCLITSHATLSAENVFKSKLPSSNSSPALRAGEEQGGQLPKIRGHSPQPAYLLYLAGIEFFFF